MLEELQDRVRNRIKSGDSLGAIDHLCEHIDQFSIPNLDDIIVARADFLHYTLGYNKNLISIDDYNIFLNQFNYRILALLKTLNFQQKEDNKPEVKASKEEEARIVLFDKKRVIIVLVEFQRRYDIIFETSYTRNKLFVKGKTVENPKKYNIFNFLSYSKRFPFEMSDGETTLKYRLDIKFSFYSGLITQFMLSRPDKILLESEL